MLPANANLTPVNYHKFPAYVGLDHARDRALEHLVNCVFGGRMNPEPRDTQRRLRWVPYNVCKIRIECEEHAFIRDRSVSNFFVAGAGEPYFQYGNRVVSHAANRSCVKWR